MRVWGKRCGGKPLPARMRGRGKRSDLLKGRSRSGEPTSFAPGLTCRAGRGPLACKFIWMHFLRAWTGRVQYHPLNCSVPRGKVPNHLESEEPVVKSVAPFESNQLPANCWLATSLARSLGAKKPAPGQHYLRKGNMVKEVQLQLLFEGFSARVCDGRWNWRAHIELHPHPTCHD